MPVHDHATHESVIKPAGRKYGCHSRGPFVDSYWAKDGIILDGTYNMIRIKHTMSTACRYTEMDRDKSCEGCTAEKDRDYLKGYGL